MKIKASKVLDVLFEIMFWICIIAAPYGVRCYLYAEAEFLPPWLIKGIVGVFMFVSVLLIFTRQNANEQEKENEKLRQKNKDLEKRLDDLQCRYDKIISRQIETIYSPIYQKQNQQEGKE